VPRYLAAVAGLGAAHIAHADIRVAGHQDERNGAHREDAALLAGLRATPAAPAFRPPDPTGDDGAVDGVYVLLGGLLTLFGSVIVNRHEVTRSTRIDLHMRVLPDLMGQVAIASLEKDPTCNGREIYLGMRDLQRRAIVASRADAKRVGELAKLEETKRELGIRLHDPATGALIGDTVPVMQQCNRLLEAMNKYADWLAKKI
jgi:hypothetical protein